MYEHLVGIDSAYCTINEQLRFSCHSTTYKSFTKCMIKAVIQDTIYWLNTFTSDNGVYNTLSLYAILQTLLDPNHGKVTINFGLYDQLHTGTDNTTKSITIGAISLISYGEHNGYHFMSLATGKKLNVLNWTELPTGDYGIGRFDEMERSDKQPIMTNGYPIFK